MANGHLTPWELWFVGKEKEERERLQRRALEVRKRLLREPWGRGLSHIWVRARACSMGTPPPTVLADCLPCSCPVD